MDESSRDETNRARKARELRLALDEFAWEAASEESSRLGVSVEDLARFSLLYYLADLDSGRIARRRGGELAFEQA